MSKETSHCYLPPLRPNTREAHRCFSAIRHRRPIRVAVPATNHSDRRASSKDPSVPVGVIRCPVEYVSCNDLHPKRASHLSQRDEHYTEVPFIGDGLYPRDIAVFRRSLHPSAFTSFTHATSSRHRSQSPSRIINLKES